MADREIILIGLTTLVGLCLVFWIARRIAVVISTFWAFHSPFGRPPSTDIRCRACGYDLRASPEQCPECGTPPTKMQATFVRYLMRIDKLDEIEARRRARGERY